MNDRELLQLAAKAAGYIEFTWGETAGPRARKPNGVAGPWNPITDDGDALRLAVKLRIDVDFDTEEVTTWQNAEWLSLAFGSDDLAATRRAIVRAAAEIGRAMP